MRNFSGTARVAVGCASPNLAAVPAALAADCSRARGIAQGGASHVSAAIAKQIRQTSSLVRISVNRC
jgi:hypothetical protein